MWKCRIKKKLILEFKQQFETLPIRKIAEAALVVAVMMEEAAIILFQPAERLVSRSSWLREGSLNWEQLQLVANERRTELSWGEPVGKVIRVE